MAAGHGIAIGQLTVQPDGTGPARSAYLDRVQSIAPTELLGRDVELRELGTICQRFDGDPYTWWQAPAWAGKSALLAWFVLHPPAHVVLLSFFVTARWYEQDNVGAFASVLIEQLAEALKEPVPHHITDATRDLCFLDLLRRAAARAEADGQRLILVVDGLDEDRGVTGRGGWHSIAGLLPADPAHGLRIIVSSRSGMRLPADVVAAHPLRRTGIRRELTVSPRAGVERKDMEEELRSLLRGGVLAQDILGLVVAAGGGGLSVLDLAELTRSSPWEIEERLITVAGRSFRPYTGQRHADPTTPVYVLAHNGLHAEAERLLGQPHLGDQRQRIHRWAADYRAQGWPSSTPEYLFQGYFALLQTAGDVPGALACALDSDRHDQMFDLTGDDVAAMTEIADLQDQLLSQEDPDLASLGRLAVHNEALLRRNDAVPTTLPAAWVSLGQPARAEALARSIADPDRRAEAATTAAEAAARTGDWNAARRLVDLIPPGGRRDLKMGDIAHLVARSDLERAGEFVALIDSHHRARARSLVARAVADRDPEAARQLALDIKDNYPRTRAVIAVARAMTSADDLDQARTLIRKATRDAALIRDPHRKVRALTALAWAQIAAGALIDAHATAERLDEPMAGVSGPSQRIRAMAGVAAMLYALDLPHRARVLIDAAETTAYQLYDDQQMVRMLVTIAHAVADGDPERATLLLADAEQRARRLTDETQRVHTLIMVAQAMDASDPDQARLLTAQAETMARDNADDAQRIHDLALVAGRLVDPAPDRANRLVEEATTAARTLSQPILDEDGWLTAAQAATEAGDPDLAESIARTSLTGGRQAAALVSIARWATGREPDRATRLTREATAATDGVRNRLSRARNLLTLAELLAHRGDVDGAHAIVEQVETMANTVNHRSYGPQLRKAVARVVQSIDGTEPADADSTSGVDDFPDLVCDPRLGVFIRGVSAIATSVDAGLAEMIAHTAGDPGARARALAAVARAIAATDTNLARTLLDQAEAISYDIDDRRERSEIYGALALGLPAGDTEGATAYLFRAESLARTLTGHSKQGQALQALAYTAARMGDWTLAERIALSIEHDKIRSRALTTIDQFRSRETVVAHQESLFGELGDPKRRGLLLTTMAMGFANLGDHARAEVLARFIDDPDIRDRALVRLVCSLSGAGDIDHARVIMALIESPDRRAAGWTAIAHAFAASGDADSAEITACTILEPRLRVRALHRVISELASQGEYHRAEDLLQRLPADDSASALAAIARAAATRGDTNRAELTAMRIADATRRASVLIELASSVEPRQARRFLAHAIRANGWRAALGTLATVDPIATRQLISELLHAFQPRR